MDKLSNSKVKIESELKEIKNEILNCQKCSLYKTRKYPVIGQGNHQPRIILIAEAPGSCEDKTGRPFCGQSGKILDELLYAVNIAREDIYITNILKCRPPGNRDPLADEINSCGGYLLRQISILKPQVICSLGNFATKYIMEKFDLLAEFKGISKIHGQEFSVKNADYGQFKIIPFYHPAVASYRINMKELLLADFKILQKFI